jgi:hypothetical protein
MTFISVVLAKLPQWGVAQIVRNMGNIPRAAKTGDAS